MRTLFTFIASLIALSILAAIGFGIYNAGVAQGIIEAGRIPAGAPVPVGYGYGYGYGWGGFHPFGFLGLLFPILFVFLIFGIIRAVSGRGRRWGGGWGGPGAGWGGPGHRGYGGYRGDAGDERQRWVADMHRRLHETDAGDATGGERSTGPSGRSTPDAGPSGGPSPSGGPG